MGNIYIRTEQDAARKAEAPDRDTGMLQVTAVSLTQQLKWSKFLFLI